MHSEILEGSQQSTLALLDRAPIPPEFYLAGGTALALHLGHRRSVDLDFFSQAPFESENLLALLRQVGEIQVERSESVIKSLVYFVDAEKEPMPVMLWPCRWDEVKAFFTAESRRVFSA